VPDSKPITQSSDPRDLDPGKKTGGALQNRPENSNQKASDFLRTVRLHRLRRQFVHVGRQLNPKFSKSALVRYGRENKPGMPLVGPIVPGLVQKIEDSAGMIDEPENVQVVLLVTPVVFATAIELIVLASASSIPRLLRFWTSVLCDLVILSSLCWPDSRSWSQHERRAGRPAHELTFINYPNRSSGTFCNVPSADSSALFRSARQPFNAASIFRCSGGSSFGSTLNSSK